MMGLTEWAFQNPGWAMFSIIALFLLLFLVSTTILYFHEILLVIRGSSQGKIKSEKQKEPISAPAIEPSMEEAPKQAIAKGIWLQKLSLYGQKGKIHAQNGLSFLKKQSQKIQEQAKILLLKSKETYGTQQEKLKAKIAATSLSLQEKKQAKQQKLAHEEKAQEAENFQNILEEPDVASAKEEIVAPPQITISSQAKKEEKQAASQLYIENQSSSDHTFINLLDGDFSDGLISSPRFQEAPSLFENKDAFIPSLENQILALSAPYVMAFEEKIDILPLDPSLILRNKLITDQTSFLNELERIRMGSIRETHEKIAGYMLKLTKTEALEFIEDQAEHPLIRHIKAVQSHRELFMDVDFMVFDVIYAATLIREAASKELGYLTHGEARNLLYKITAPLLQKKYSWEFIGKSFRAGQSLYHVKYPRLVQELNESVAKLLKNHDLPWVMQNTYFEPSNQHKILPLRQTSESFQHVLDRWFFDIYAYERTYEDSFHQFQQEVSAKELCGFLNSFTFGYHMYGQGVLCRLGERLNLSESEIEDLTIGFILHGPEALFMLSNDADQAMLTYGSKILYVQEGQVSVQPCFHHFKILLLEYLGDVIGHMQDRNEAILGYLLTMEEQLEASQEGRKSYIEDLYLDDFPQFYTWLAAQK